jgi:hypothetical protein
MSNTLKPSFMGGIIGTYEGNIGKYLPLFDIATLVHIGKQTTVGMGKIAWKTAG